MINTNTSSAHEIQENNASKLMVISRERYTEMAECKIPIPRYEILAIEDLKVAKYQREPRRNHYLDIAKNFDPDILGVPIVSYRPTDEGNYWIIDGQNRVRALDHLKAKYVNCQLVEGLTIEDEAEKYLKLNTKRKALNANQKFLGKLGKKDKVALDIVKILERNGFDYATNTGIKEKNKVACLSSCFDVYNRLNAVEFENIFKAIRKIWDGSSASVHVQIIRGLGGFIEYHGEYYDIEILTASLKKVKPEKLLDDAVELDDSKGKRSGNWASKSNNIYVSKQIWKHYDNYCKENNKKRIPYMFD